MTEERPEPRERRPVATAPLDVAPELLDASGSDGEIADPTGSDRPPA